MPTKSKIDEVYGAICDLCADEDRLATFWSTVSQASYDCLNTV